MCCVINQGWVPSVTWALRLVPLRHCFHTTIEWLLTSMLQIDQVCALQGIKCMCACMRTYVRACVSTGVNVFKLMHVCSCDILHVESSVGLLCACFISLCIQLPSPSYLFYRNCQLCWAVQAHSHTGQQCRVWPAYWDWPWHGMCINN